MAKSSKKVIEQDEQKIINILQRNADASIDQVAKQCKFSRQKAWRLIKQLEKKRVIWGYTAIVDEEERGQKNYILLVKRTMNPLDDKTLDLLTSTMIEETVSKYNMHVETSCYVHGEFDWVIIFSAQDIQHAKKFCEILTGKFSKYIEKITLMEILFYNRKNNIFNPDAKKIKEFL